MNADGSNQRRITDSSAWEWIPVWSPDSSKIAYTCAENQNSMSDVYLMHADGGNKVKLTDTTRYSGYPSWSPDGSRIIFHAISEEEAEIYSMNIDGSDIRCLTNNKTFDQQPCCR
jgi:Tol biopolymer transport system component